MVVNTVSTYLRCAAAVKFIMRGGGIFLSKHLTCFVSTTVNSTNIFYTNFLANYPIPSFRVGVVKRDVTNSKF